MVAKPGCNFAVRDAPPRYGSGFQCPDLGSRGVNEASARLVEALLGCTNVFDEFEASKEQVSELEKRLALD
nr:hypothetical protein Iba_chr11dCG13410 [Ipomoea batatas]